MALASIEAEIWSSTPFILVGTTAPAENGLIRFEMRSRAATAANLLHPDEFQPGRAVDRMLSAWNAGPIGRAPIGWDGAMCSRRCLTRGRYRRPIRTGSRNSRRRSMRDRAPARPRTSASAASPGSTRCRTCCARSPARSIFATCSRNSPPSRVACSRTTPRSRSCSCAPTGASRSGCTRSASRTGGTCPRSSTIRIRTS